ncbi:MAG: membrane dipeptidase, partial [Rubrobacter sp.]|nr:membrane dipeptidase [Rubrobacter sp.]
MNEGGLTAANCTCSVWEGFTETMKAVGQWKGWFQEHSDVLTQVYQTDDIRRAKREGKVGVVLGFQNTTAFDDH